MRALITGITGQDGSYLAELLLEKGYEVHGLVRRISNPAFPNIAAVRDRITLHTGDMQDAASLFRVIRQVYPDEIYNLAAMSQVRDSYDNPTVTHDINALGLLRILESVKTIGLKSATKIYQACSSEMYGKIVESPQNEKTPFYPRSPYGASKVAAYNIARLYRESYGLWVYCGILFNHESPRRGEAFLSRKVCKAVAAISSGAREKLYLGNLGAKRDWGYAPEYVEWIYKIMQHTEPDDFVIATGEAHSVLEWVEAAFACAGIENWEDHVSYDKHLIRPSEVDSLRGDASKSRKVLGFEPKVRFNELIKIMVDAEMKLLPKTGYHADNRRTLETFPEAKVITALKDTVLGGHFHKKKTERFILSSGACEMREQNFTRKMVIGQIYVVPPGHYHEFQIKSGSVLVGLNSHPYDPSDDYK